MCVHIYVYIYIYIYRERERDRRSSWDEITTQTFVSGPETCKRKRVTRKADRKLTLFCEFRGAPGTKS